MNDFPFTTSQTVTGIAIYLLIAVIFVRLSGGKDAHESDIVGAMFWPGAVIFMCIAAPFMLVAWTGGYRGKDK